MAGGSSLKIWSSLYTAFDWYCALKWEKTCRGTWVRVTIDQCRHVALQTRYSTNLGLLSLAKAAVAHPGL